jgi:Ferritin-like domain
VSDLITVELTDAEAARSEGATRHELFKKALVGGGAFAAGGLAIGGLPSLALGKPSKKQDGEILNFALLLEYLESTFYVRAVESGALQGEILEFAKTVRDHELAHVKALKTALGSAAIKEPTFDFKNTVTDQNTFIATSITLEDTGVAAYDGQGTRLRRRTLPAAAAIVSVEARHAAWIRYLAGKFGQDAHGGPAPDAVNPALSKAKVTAAVQATGFITG